MRAPRLILDLFREKFAGLGEEIDAGFGFDMIRLSVPVSAAAAPAQVDLAGDAVGEADLDRLIDRIGARLGPERVSRIAGRQPHPGTGAALRSRRHGRTIAPGGVARVRSPASRSTARSASSPGPSRSRRLAAVPDGPPLHFRWRRALYEVARAEGPERIAAEWWREDGLTRDYFRVEDTAGHRFWLFRDGLYGRETRPRAGTCTGCSGERGRLFTSSPSPPISPSSAAARIPRSWWRRPPQLGLPGIAVADRNSVAGVVRGHAMAKETGFRYPSAAGSSSATARRTSSPGRPTAPPMAGSAGCSPLGNRRAEKGDCHLDLADLLAWGEGLMLGVVPADAARRSVRQARSAPSATPSPATSG